MKQLEGGSKVKVVHINTLKAYVERDAYVRRLTIVAESGEGDAELTGKLVGQSSQYVEGEIEAILHEFSDVMQAKPGCTKTTVMEMDVGGARPIAQAPRSVATALKEGVREEMKKLSDEGIIVPSCSPWVSLLVPVVKPDKSVRLCVDYS